MSSAIKNTLVDSFNRSIDYVRIAVTSQCNLRCTYCMSEAHVERAGNVAVLTTQEITTIIDVLASVGVTKIRFTGGEPLLRMDIVELVGQAKKAGIKKVTLTTNGLLLDRFFSSLIDAGLDAINVSIDSLDSRRYHAITRRDEYRRVKKNLDQLLSANVIPVKLNVVMMRDINSNELLEFVDFTRDHAVTVRFLELQPFDDNQIWRTGKFLGAEKIQELLKHSFPELQTIRGNSTQYYSYILPGHKGTIAIIPAFTRNFCSQCNKIRITSEGKIISCLYKKEGLTLLPLLRGNATHDMLSDLLRKAVLQKPEDGKHGAGDSSRTSMSEIGG